MAKITKAVIAAAGFGTRFLPQTKAMPKEMLPLVDKPIIQYVVEDLVSAGIRDIIIVGSSNKRAIEDHFDLPREDLLNNLRAGGDRKKHYIDGMEAIANLANFVYVRQKGTYGNATPVLNAAHLLDDEPFVYTYADDFFVASPGRTSQMLEVYKEFGAPVLACKAVSEDSDYDRYGIVGGSKIADGLIKADKIIEKPGKKRAPSKLASVSGYILTHDIFEYIERLQNRVEANGELYLQPAMQAMMDAGHTFYAKLIDGVYHDTGDKLEYLKTVVDFALSRPDTGPAFNKFLRSKLT